MKRRPYDSKVIGVLGDAIRQRTEVVKTKPVPVRSVSKGEIVDALKADIRELVRLGYSVAEVSELLKKKGVDVSPSLIWKRAIAKTPPTSDRARMPKAEQVERPVRAVTNEQSGKATTGGVVKEKAASIEADKVARGMNGSFRQEREIEMA